MGDIWYDVVGTIAKITISNPEVRNGLNPRMCQRLTDACEEIDGNADLTAVVILGADGTFCSGADTRQWTTTMLDPASEEAYRSTSTTYGAFVRFGHLRIPTIAAVRGAAVGAGLNLALAADLRVCASNARFIAGFGRAGIHPGGGFFSLAARSAGRQVAAGLGLFNLELSGAEAARQGLAYLAVPDEEVEPRALDIARGAVDDPELGRLALASFRSEVEPPGVPWAAALEIERGAQMWSQRRRAHRLAGARSES